MKQKLKLYLKIGILLFGIVFLNSSCQKDDDFKTTEQHQNINQTDFKISKVDKSNLEENTKLNRKLTKLSKNLKKSKSSTTQNKTVVSSTYGFTIDTDYANYIESADGAYHSYTFYMQRDVETDILENLLLSLQPDGSYKIAIITYNITAQEKEDIFNGINVDLSNKVSSTTINDEGLITSIFSKAFDCEGYSIIEYCSCINSNTGESYHNSSTGYSNCSPECYNYDRKYFGCGNSGGGTSSGTGPGPSSSPGTSGTGQASNGGGAPPDQGDVTILTPPCRGDDCPEPIDEEFISDCNVLSQLSQSPDFITKMNELKTATAGNIEISYLGITDSNGNTTFPSNYRKQGLPNSNDVPLAIPTTPINVMLHNHATITITPVVGNGSLPVQSPGDMNGIWQFYDNSYITNLDNFVSVVVTPDQTVYALTINSQTNFNTNGEKFLKTIDLAELFYNNEITQGKTNDLNETAFAKKLKELNMGITLYRGNFNQEQTDAPFTKWSRIKIKNDGTKKLKNCN